MTDFTLILGNKAYSSWSLRGWLAMKRTGAPFAEAVVPLSRPDTHARMAELSEAPPKVPVLKHGECTIWDTLAIVEYLAEQFPAAGLWPEEATARATARSIAAEMHSSFAALRQALPMDLKSPAREARATPEATMDIARIRAMWLGCRRRFGAGGPFLFGAYSAADAMYAPVASRFRTYGAALEPELRDYVDAALGVPEMAEWTAAALAEPWVIEYP